jgi:MscS family membrane protein
MAEIWENFLRFYNDSFIISHLLVPAFIVLAGYFLSIAISRIILKIGKAFAGRTRTTLDDEIFTVFYPPIKWFIYIFICYLALASIPGDKRIINIAQLLLVSVIIIIFTVILARVLKTVIAWYIGAKSRTIDKLVGREFIPVLEKIGVILLYILGLIWVLDDAGIDVSGLVVSLGVGGIAIGFAAKDALANVIAGFMLMFDKPFRVGDRIELSDGRIGDVIELGLRTTRVATFDDAVLIIPNQELLQKEIINYAYPTRRVKRTILLSVAYGTNLDNVKKIILALCAKEDSILKDPSPAVWVTGFGDFGMELAVYLWVADLSYAWKVQYSLTEKIYSVLTKEGIELPYQGRTVLIKDNVIKKRREKRER